MLDRTLSVLHNPKGLSACLPSFLPFFLPSMQTYFIEFQGKERMRNKHLGVWSGTFHTNSQPRKVTLSKTLVMLEQEMAWRSAAPLWTFPLTTKRRQMARGGLEIHPNTHRTLYLCYVIHKDYLLPSMYVLKCVSLSLLFGLQVVSHMLQTLWTPAHQAPLPMAFPSQEYWSGLPFPSLISLTYPQKYVSLWTNT